MSGDVGVVDNEEWVTMWSVGDTGFHQSTHDRFLDNYREEYFGGKKNIFLPLCGKSLDLLWLYNHGHTVCGVEIAEQAVQEFFQENNIEFNLEDVEDIGKLYQTKDARLKLYVADIFDMSPNLRGQFDIIFDSKAFVAVNKPDRQKYVDLVLSLMRKEGQYYLTTIEYDPEVWPGPPHTSPVEVVTHFYGKRCSIELLEKEDEVIKEKTNLTAVPGEASIPKEYMYKDITSAFQASSYLMFRWYKMTLKQ